MSLSASLSPLSPSLYHATTFSFESMTWSIGASIWLIRFFHLIASTHVEWKVNRLATSAGELSGLFLHWACWAEWQKSIILNFTFFRARKVFFDLSGIEIANNDAVDSWQDDFLLTFYWFILRGSFCGEKMHFRWVIFPSLVVGLFFASLTTMELCVRTFFFAFFLLHSEGQTVFAAKQHTVRDAFDA